MTRTLSDADVESFSTYYACCYRCRWDGPEHEDDLAAAQRDADEHVCPSAEAETDERPDGIMPPAMFDLEPADSDKGADRA